MDRFHMLNVFLAIVDTGGFAPAARRLNLSPPAVTRAVAELEDHLGVRLLTRTTRSVRLTDAGVSYTEDCRRILADLELADETVSGADAPPKGRLNITAPVLFGSLYVTPVVAEYLQRYVDVSITCLFVDRVINIVDEGVDVAVRIGELPNSTLQAIQVGQVGKVICASPQYLSKMGTPKKPQDLVDHTIISSNTVTPSFEWNMNENGVARAVRIHPRMVTSTNDSAIVAATGGLGLTRLLSYQVADFLRDGRLVRVLPEFELKPDPIHVIHREGRRVPQKVRTFLDLVVERLRKALVFPA